MGKAALSHEETMKKILALPTHDSLAEKSAEEIQVPLKLFLPEGRWTWFCYAYDPEYRLLSCYVHSGLGEDCDEAGDTSLDELLTLRTSLNLPVERDLFWKPKTLKEVMESR